MNLFLDFFTTKVAYADAFDTFMQKANALIINPLITLLFALAVVYFLWGVFEFIANQDNEEKKTTGKSHMLWGIVGIVIMMGVFVIMGVILNTLGVNNVTVNNGTVNVTNPQ